MTTEATTALAPIEHREVVGYEWLYSVASDGRVLGRERLVLDKRIGVRLLANREMTPTEVHGYFYVSLTDYAGAHRRFSVHRLVCEAFHGSPSGNVEVNHMDGNKANNSAANLEWVTRRENLIHAANHGLKPVGIGSHLAKLTEDQVREIRALAATKTLSQRVIGERYGVSQTCINKIVTRKKWKQLAA